MALPAALLAAATGAGAALAAEVGKGIAEQAAQTVKKEAMKRTDQYVTKGVAESESAFEVVANKIKEWDW